MNNKMMIEKEFKTWVKQFVDGEIVVSVNTEVFNMETGKNETAVTLYQEDGSKANFEYLGNGKFQYYG